MTLSVTKLHIHSLPPLPLPLLPHPLPLLHFPLISSFSSLPPCPSLPAFLLLLLPSFLIPPPPSSLLPPPSLL